MSNQPRIVEMYVNSYLDRITEENQSTSLQFTVPLDEKSKQVQLMPGERSMKLKVFSAEIPNVLYNFKPTEDRLWFTYIKAFEDEMAEGVRPSNALSTFTDSTDTGDAVPRSETAIIDGVDYPIHFISKNYSNFPQLRGINYGTQDGGTIGLRTQTQDTISTSTDATSGRPYMTVTATNSETALSTDEGTLYGLWFYIQLPSRRRVKAFKRIARNSSIGTASPRRLKMIGRKTGETQWTVLSDEHFYELADWTGSSTYVSRDASNQEFEVDEVGCIANEWYNSNTLGDWAHMTFDLIEDRTMVSSVEINTERVYSSASSLMTELNSKFPSLAIDSSTGNTTDDLSGMTIAYDDNTKKCTLTNDTTRDVRLISSFRYANDESILTFNDMNDRLGFSQNLTTAGTMDASGGTLEGDGFIRMNRTNRYHIVLQQQQGYFTQAITPLSSKNHRVVASLSVGAYGTLSTFNYVSAFGFELPTSQPLTELAFSVMDDEFQPIDFINHPITMSLQFEMS